jgi:hypothetical protein
MGKMFKPGESKVKTSSTSAPWATQTPFIKDAFGQAQNLYKAGQTPNSDMTASWNMTRNNVNDPNSGSNQAKNYWSGVLKNGGYDENVWQNISSPIIADITSRFMGSGRTGGGLEGINLADTLTKAYSPFAINQANMAASQLPMLEAGQAASLAGIGDEQFAYPWQNLGNYYNIVGGNNWGGTSSGVNTTATPSPFSQIAGAGIGLAGSALTGGLFSRPQSIY